MLQWSNLLQVFSQVGISSKHENLSFPKISFIFLLPHGHVKIWDEVSWQGWQSPPWHFMELIYFYSKKKEGKEKKN